MRSALRELKENRRLLFSHERADFTGNVVGVYGGGIITALPGKAQIKTPSRSSRIDLHNKYRGCNA